jgi:methyl-accepting chemotaxis protein
MTLSIRTRIVSTTTVINIILTGLAFLSLYYMDRESRAQYRIGLLNDSSGVTSEIQALFYERYGDVQAFAANPNILSENPVVRRDILNKYIALYGIYDAITIYNTEGKLMSYSTKDKDSNDLKSIPNSYWDASQEEWFRNVKNNKFTEDKEKGLVGTYITEPTFDVLTTAMYGKQRYGNLFATVIKDSQDKLLGYIVNHANFYWAAQPILVNSKKSEKIDVLKNYILMNKKGNVLFNYNAHASKEVKDKIFNPDILGKPSEHADILLPKLLAGETGVFAHTDPGEPEEESAFMRFDGDKFIKDMGWSLIVQEKSEDLYAALVKEEQKFLIISFIAFLLILGYSIIFSYGIAKSLRHLAEQLSIGSKSLFKASSEISSSSSQLSEASTEQAAALQETVASMNEISAMVEKSSDMAKRSRETSKTAKKAADGGKHTVNEMINAIKDISQSNQQVMTQMEKSNQELVEIVKVIGEISHKTKVINDIVFQTKLLSFNASVEAARAGEHGKGFAVVAEEVGNLAQMSGNASKEISGLLEQSVKRVEDIVQNTKSNIEKLVSSAKEKIYTGNVTAQKCDGSLDNILENVSEVDGMVTEISTASEEQSKGVQEINSAMNQLDQVTQKNSTIAQETSLAGEELHKESLHLSHIVEDLLSFVDGKVKALKEADNSHEDHETSHHETRSFKDKSHHKKESIVKEESIPHPTDSRFKEIA